MNFALVNGERTEAQKGGRGTCSHCHGETIAKCGCERIWHWAHRSKDQCDPWLEGETKWHRAWKGRFPRRCQEFKVVDPATGKWHVADVRTDSGLVIEFQHSAIRSDQIQSREDFYGNMVWVVDGTRSPVDYRRFCKGTRDLTSGPGYAGPISSIWDDVLSTCFPRLCFPKRWLQRSVPVYFDFQGIAFLDQPDEKRPPLWCFIPKGETGWAGIAKLQRRDFAKCAVNAPHLLLTQEIRTYVAQQRANRERGKIEDPFGSSG